MGAYVVRRLLLLVPTLLVVTLVAFLSVRFIPGNVVDIMLAQAAGSSSITQESRQALIHAMGLDVPLPIQYGRWLGVLPQENGQFQGVLEGNLGTSLWS